MQYYYNNTLQAQPGFSKWWLLLLLVVVITAVGGVWWVMKGGFRLEKEGLAEFGLHYKAIAFMDGEPTDHNPEINYVIASSVTVVPANEKNKIAAVSISDIRIHKKPPKGTMQVIKPRHASLKDSDRDMYYRSRDEKEPAEFLDLPAQVTYRIGNDGQQDYFDQINEQGGTIDFRLAARGIGDLDVSKIEEGKMVMPKYVLKHSDIDPADLDSEIEFTVTADVGRWKREKKTMKITIDGKQLYEKSSVEGTL